MCSILHYFVFFNDTATTEIYTLSLHDALPICVGVGAFRVGGSAVAAPVVADDAVGLREVVELVVPHAPVGEGGVDRKSTRLNSSHANISYAVFCLKKKKTIAPKIGICRRLLDD